MAILYQDEYKRYIVSRGVGTNDKVASSVDSYLSYLRSVGNHLGIDVSPGTLSCEDDVQRLGCELEGVRKPRTIDNSFHGASANSDFLMPNVTSNAQAR